MWPVTKISRNKWKKKDYLFIKAFLVPALCDAVLHKSLSKSLMILANVLITGKISDIGEQCGSP